MATLAFAKQHLALGVDDGDRDADGGSRLGCLGSHSCTLQNCIMKEDCCCKALIFSFLMLLWQDYGVEGGGVCLVYESFKKAGVRWVKVHNVPVAESHSLDGLVQNTPVG